MYVCIQTIMHWAMISFWGGLFLYFFSPFLFYLDLGFFWERKEETEIRPYISMVLWGRTGKVTVSLLPIELLLYLRDGFLQLSHGDREAATPRCPSPWADASRAKSRPLHVPTESRGQSGDPRSSLSPFPGWRALPGSQGYPSGSWEMPLPKAGANHFRNIQAK